MSDSQEIHQIPMEILAKNLVDVGFKYTWKIEDYLKGLEDLEGGLDSPVFGILVNGLETRWSLGLRYWMDEAGLRLTNPVVICLNLVSASLGTDISEQLQVRYQFGIWNNAQKQFEVCPVGCQSVEVTGAVAQPLQSVGTREIMILDRHLMGNSIEIFCKIMLVRQEVEQNTLALDLWTKLRNCEDCDVKIKTCDGHLIPAHQTILVCRSQPLKEMIDAEGVIKLDMNTPLLTSLLQYIYTDRVDPLDNPQNLLKFAVKLELPGLKRICEKALIDQITPTTIASLLLFADTFGCESLKKSAMSYCGENSRQMVKTVSWKVMEEVNPRLFEEVCEQM